MLEECSQTIVEIVASISTLQIKDMEILVKIKRIRILLYGPVLKEGGVICFVNCELILTTSSVEF